eukprot:6273839-Prymnesium_polylepis.1
MAMNVNVNVEWWSGDKLYQHFMDGPGEEHRILMRTETHKTHNKRPLETDTQKATAVDPQTGTAFDPQTGRAINPNGTANAVDPKMTPERSQPTAATNPQTGGSKRPHRVQTLPDMREELANLQSKAHEAHEKLRAAREELAAAEEKRGTAAVKRNDIRSALDDLRRQLDGKSGDEALQAQAQVKQLNALLENAQTDAIAAKAHYDKVRKAVAAMVGTAAKLEEDEKEKADLLRQAEAESAAARLEKSKSRRGGRRASPPKASKAKRPPMRAYGESSATVESDDWI